MSAHAARPTTSLKTLPADARTAFAPNGSAHPASTTSAGAPVAAAVRQMAPTLPGSCTRSSTTSGQPASRAARAASAGVASCTRTTAITPWGETVWVAARYAAGVSVTRDSEWNGSLSPSRTAMSSKSSPAALASLSTRGPSRRARPGSRRRARRRSLRTTSLSGLLISGWLEVVLGNLHQPGKGTAVAHGQVSQHLAVDLHSGLAKAVHQLVVGQPRLPRGGVDPRDPKLAHLALAAAAVAERVGERVKDRLVSGTEQELLGKPEALGPVEDPLVAAMRRYAALDSCHLGLDPQRPADRFAVALEHRLLGVVLALVLLRLLVQAVAHPGVAANDLPVASHAHALSDSLAGLELRHWSLTPSARRPRPAGSAPGS